MERLWGAPPAPAVSPSPGGGLARFNEAGIAFDYPASWRLFRYQAVSSFSSLIAYLATVDVPEPCVTTGTPSNTLIECGDRYRLAPGTLVVKIESNGWPMFDILSYAPPGSQRTVVGGLPAVLEDSGPNRPVLADQRLTWTIARPGSVDNFYRIVADLRGPDLERLRSEVEAVIASLRYDPPVEPLPTGPDARHRAYAAALGTLRGLAADDPAYACFPSAPDTAAKALLTSAPHGPALVRPIPVVCSWHVEPTDLQLWRLTLEITWRTGGPDQPFGRYVEMVWLTPDGTIVGASATGDPFPAQEEPFSQ